MTAEPLNDIPPLTASGTILKEVAVMGERLSGLKANFEEFRAETRNNFDESKKAVAEFKVDVKQDGLAIRDEMREGFRAHHDRIVSLERDRDQARGGVSVGRWLWGVGVAVVGMAGAVAGWVGRSQ